MNEYIHALLFGIGALIILFSFFTWLILKSRKDAREGGFTQK